MNFNPGEMVRGRRSFLSRRQGRLRRGKWFTLSGGRGECNKSIPCAKRGMKEIYVEKVTVQKTEGVL